MPANDIYPAEFRTLPFAKYTLVPIDGVHDRICVPVDVLLRDTDVACPFHVETAIAPLTLAGGSIAHNQSSG